MDDGMDDDDDYEFGAGEFDLVAAMAEMEQEAALAAHVSPRERPEQGEGRGRVREQAASSTEAMLRLQVASTEAMRQVASTEATSQVAPSQVMQQATRQTTPSRPLYSERPSRLQQTVTTGQLPRPCKSDMPSPHPQPTSPRPQLRATIPGPAGILPDLTREQKTHLFLSKGAGTTASLTPAPAAPNVHADGSTSARALSSSDVAVLKDDLVFRHAANVWQRMREDVTGVNRGARNDGSRAMADEDMIDEQIPPVMSIAQVQDALHELQASAATSLTAGALRRDAAVRTMLSVKVPRMIAIIKHVGPVKTRVGAAQDVTVRLVDGSGDALACIDSRVFLDHGPVLTVGAGLMLREVTALGFRHQPKRQLVLVIVRNTIECVYARTTASSLPPSVPQYRRQESNASTRVDTVENRNILTISEAPVVDLTSSQHQAPLYVQDNHGENGAETGDKENCCRIRNMIDQDQLLEFADSENTTKNYLLEAKVPQTPYTAFKAKEHSTTSDDAAIALARADSSECEFDPNQLLIGLENLSDEWL